ncbi:hypothetical protein PRBEI_2000424600 [Prionailurus iriomotensis]
MYHLQQNPSAGTKILAGHLTECDAQSIGGKFISWDWMPD